MTPFRSLDFYDGFPALPARPGPVPFEKGEYLKGTTPAGLTGEHFCGELEWFKEGIPSPPPPPLNRNAEGVPDCCVNAVSGKWEMELDLSFVFAAFSNPLSFRQCAVADLKATTDLVWPLLTQDGSALIACFLGHKGFSPLPTSVAAPPGWTLLQTQTSTLHVQQSLYAKLNAASEGNTGNWFLTGPWLRAGLIGVEVAGTNTASQIDIVYQDQGIGFPPPTFSIGTQTQVYAFGVAFFGSTAPIGFGPAGFWSRHCMFGAGPVIYENSYTRKIDSVGPVVIGSPAPSWTGWQWSAVTILAEGAAVRGLFDVDVSIVMDWQGSINAPGVWTSTIDLAFSWVGQTAAPSDWTSTIDLAFSWVGHVAAPTVLASTIDLAFSWVGQLSGSGPAIVQQRKSTSTGTTNAISWSPSTTTGNLLIVAGHVADSAGTAPTITPPAGWSTARNRAAGGGGNNGRTFIFYRPNSASQSSTGNFTAANAAEWVIFGIEVSGASATVPLDQVADDAGTSGGVWRTGTTPTTTQAAELAVGCIGQALGTVTWSAPTNGYTLADQASAGSLSSVCLLTKVLSATGAQSTQVSGGSIGEQWVGAIATWK